MALAGEDTIVEDRLEAERGELGHAGVELRAIEGARRGDDRDAIAGTKCTWPPHHTKLAHLFGDRTCSVAPSSARSVAGAAAGRPAGEKALLHPPMPPERIVESRPRDDLGLGRADDALDRGRLQIVIGAADEHGVAAGRDGLGGRRRDRHPRATAFISRSSVNTTPSKPSSYGHRLDDRARQRRRATLVQRRHEHVRRHEGRNAGVDGGPERHHSTSRRRSRGCSTSASSWCESCAVSPCPGKCLPQAAIPSRCSVSMIVLPREATAGVLGQRPIADHRVPGVGEDVEDRGEIERDAHRAQFDRHRPGEARRQCGIAGAAERQHRRPSVNGRFSRATRPPS